MVFLDCVSKMKSQRANNEREKYRQGFDIWGEKIIPMSYTNYGVGPQGAHLGEDKWR